jgi:tetratricopeptide (TPR) repeat protein
VLLVYWTALSAGFINYDDPAYVTKNPNIQHRLDASSIAWAFTTSHAANWHPLTWISHIIDFDLYGLKPAGHHLSSVLFHMANAVLLFLLLNRATGAFWRSALVAAFFSLHPLRAESVAWVSERKDVLSAFFWMLTLWAYLKSRTSSFKIFYPLALLFFAFGLMAKPMLVTLPFVLLLLDYWPLRRFRVDAGRVPWRILAEKIPFLFLAAISCVVTFLAQSRSGAVSAANFPLDARLANVPVAYTRYLARNFWPSNLAFFYEYRTWPMFDVLGAVVLLAAITAMVLWRWRLQPYLAVGWFWFLGMLLPTIGLVQVGSQSLADRYTYLPSIGLWLAVVWGIYEFATHHPPFLKPAVVGSGLLVTAFAVLTWHQAGLYHDSEKLWRATLRQEPDSLVALDNLSRCLMENGQLEEAAHRSRQALAIRPTDFEAENILADISLRQGKPADAIACALHSLTVQPHDGYAYDVLARAYLSEGKIAEAAEAFQTAVKLEPTLAEAWCNLGFTMLQLHRVPEALKDYQKALDLDPNYALAHNDLGNILLQEGQLNDALEHFVRAAEIAPGFAEAHYNLGEILLKQGRTSDALGEYEKALASRPNLARARLRISQITNAGIHHP